MNNLDGLLIPSVTDLDLGNNNLDDYSVAKILNSSLIILCLGNTQISDITLENIHKKCKAIKMLDLTGTDITKNWS